MIVYETWPIEEIESLRKQQIQLLDYELQSGNQYEIAGILGTQADIVIEFELPSLEGAESLDNSLLLDPSKLCNEIGPFDKGGIGPFGLFVLTSDNDLEDSSRREGVYKPAYGALVSVDISKDKKISLRTLIDHSVVESFAGSGRTCMTLRVYPKHVLTGQASGMYVFNHGFLDVKINELNAWEMENARVNVENDNFISKDYI
ncbi:hypothetical protein LUZ62_035159 [Rhynchospora pubera]|uniref:Glycosyl hydrolase family 32 C-terminal domain-containing protein n=1 Tax=Rhynchospora pubera TaxID=906938 RepID=A0AAV8ERW7_9POAL|nr:hypothetical protein LUZ62_035159 [Rhynchospora pubera]